MLLQKYLNNAVTWIFKQTYKYKGVRLGGVRDDLLLNFLLYYLF